MTVDRDYCIGSFLMLRTIYDHDKTFAENVTPRFFPMNSDRNPVNNSCELESILREQVNEAVQTGKAALALSGGIDSAILAKMMPKGSVAYTFKCVVPGVEVIDESPAAAAYATECGLEHRIVEVYWDDFEKFAPLLMKHKGAPIHSIEVQIYKAALTAMKDGFDVLIFGESSDVNFGGQDGLLSRDWTVPQYIERYSYLLPHKVVKKPVFVTEAFEAFVTENGLMDMHEFNRTVYYQESMGSYTNAAECAGIRLSAPFSKTYLAQPLDLERIRNGENKYLVREVFEHLYPNWRIPVKTPMPRPMNEWMEKWKGPKRAEFWPNCVNGLTGDQKWQLWALEQFLNIIDNN